MSKLLFLVTALMSLNSYADSNRPKSCYDLTATDRNQIGFQCITVRSGPNYRREFLWERVIYKNFGEAWQVTFSDGSKGAIWSETFGLATNSPEGTPNKAKPISDSDAAIICQIAGGRLPSRSDFDGFHLISNFIFNPIGKPDMIYPSGSYWTSTIYEYDYIGYYGAYIYYPSHINTQFGWDNFEKEHSVICISE